VAGIGSMPSCRDNLAQPGCGPFLKRDGVAEAFELADEAFAGALGVAASGGLASTTEASIWRSRMAQYLFRGAGVCSGPTSSKP
jgi:hypothetical protein